MLWLAGNVTVVWHDPGAVQREVLYGSAVIVASIVFTIFSIYATAFRTRFAGYRGVVVVFGGWLILFTVQLAYIASRATIVYGVSFNATSGEFTYSTAENPMALPVALITIATAVAVIASLLIMYSRVQFERLRRVVIVD